MPNIDKVKKTKTKKKLQATKLPVVKTVAKKTKSVAKKDVVAYYNCLLTKAQSG